MRRGPHSTVDRQGVYSCTDTMAMAMPINGEAADAVDRGVNNMFTVSHQATPIDIRAISI